MNWAIAAITIAEIEPGSAIIVIEIHQKNLMETTFSNPSDRKLNFKSVFMNLVSGSNLALV